MPTNVVIHLLLIASIVIAMSARWARVNFDVRDPSWVEAIPGGNTDTGIFSCPTNKWYIFAYNGFCSHWTLDDGSRGNPDDTNCITWNNDKHWMRMQNANVYFADFSTGSEQWEAIGALLALSLFLSIVTLIASNLKSMWHPWPMGIFAVHAGLNFASLLTAWILALTSAQMHPNNWDAMPGCGNSSFSHDVGFGFAVVASGLALFLTLLMAVAAAADAISRFRDYYDTQYKAPGAVVGHSAEEAKYDTRADDRQVQGYRPDIVA